MESAAGAEPLLLLEQVCLLPLDVLLLLQVSGLHPRHIVCGIFINLSPSTH